MVVPAERDYRARSPQRGVLIMDQRPEQQPEWTTQSQQTAGQVPRAAPMEGERPLPLHQGRRLASWGSRVVSYIIDAIFGLLLGGPKGLLRWLVDTVIGWFGILWILNYLWPLWDQRNQTWADKAVGSVVLAR